MIVITCAKGEYDPYENVNPPEYIYTTYAVGCFTSLDQAKKALLEYESYPNDEDNEQFFNQLVKEECCEVDGLLCQLQTIDASGLKTADVCQLTLEEENPSQFYEPGTSNLSSPVVTEIKAGKGTTVGRTVQSKYWKDGTERMVEALSGIIVDGPMTELPDLTC